MVLLAVPVAMRHRWALWGAFCMGIITFVLGFVVLAWGFPGVALPIAPEGEQAIPMHPVVASPLIIAVVLLGAMLWRDRRRL